MEAPSGGDVGIVRGGKTITMVFSRATGEHLQNSVQESLRLAHRPSPLQHPAYQKACPTPSTRPPSLSPGENGIYPHGSTGRTPVPEEKVVSGKPTWLILDQLKGPPGSSA